MWQFIFLYHFAYFYRKKSKSHRDIKRMQCECPILPREERAKGALACGEDCLNRLLMIEW